MRRQGGILFPYEFVETGILIILLVLGFFLVSIVSDRSIEHTEEQASIQRDIYLANEMLYILSATPVNTSKGTILFSECLNEYYKIKLMDDKSDNDEKYQDELYDLMIETGNLVFGSSRPYIDSKIYNRGTGLDSFKIYSNQYNSIKYLPANIMPAAFIGTLFTNKEYVSSLILPSSIDRGENYYINVSMYFYN